MIRVSFLCLGFLRPGTEVIKLFLLKPVIYPVICLHFNIYEQDKF